MYDKPEVSGAFEYLSKQIDSLEERIDKRFTSFENKLEERIRVNGRQNEDLMSVKTRIENIEENIQNINARIENMDKRLTDITENLVNALKQTSVKSWAILGSVIAILSTLIYIVERVLK